MVQHSKPLPVMLASQHGFKSLVHHFQSSFLPMYLKKQKRMLQVLESWHQVGDPNVVVVQVPGVFLAQLLWLLEEGTSRWEVSLSITLSFRYIK